jgi:hypothetical protein
MVGGQKINWVGRTNGSLTVRIGVPFVGFVIEYGEIGSDE